MTTSSNELYTYAETALAAYANGAQRTNAGLYKLSLVGQGMGAAQANAFWSDFRVIDYFSDGVGADRIGVTGLGQGTGLPSFASATVFERVSTGERILAIRGTNNPLDWPTDLVSIFTFGSPKYQFQYSILKEKVVDWISKGVLKSGFIVTGHSLGGFLAAALTADAGPDIRHTYLFNAPGFGGFRITGMTANLDEWVSKLRPGGRALDESKITNVTAEGGVSLVSGLGIAVGDRVSIAVETALQPSLDVVQLYKSHKIELLTDALAVYDLLAKIDPQISLDASTAILQAAAPDNRETLERVLNALARPLGIAPTASGDISRDELFDKIDQISDAVTAADPYHIISLIDKTAKQVVNLARDDISVRYALKQLDPFALSGRDELFVPFNAGGQLDLARDDGTGGPLTLQWLADRAELVSALGWAHTYELGDTIQSGTRPARDYVFISATGDSETMHVVGTQAGDMDQVVFGSAQTDTLTGRDAADHLYGDSGDDRISGGKGNDYLEGGPGDDTLDAGAGADRIDGGIGNDTYLMQRNGGSDVIVDSGGEGRIELDGVVLTGGKGERPGTYVGGNVRYTFLEDLASSGTLVIEGTTEVHHFRNGDFGITLVAGDPVAVDAPTATNAGGQRIYIDYLYDEVIKSLEPTGMAVPRDPWGSAMNDTFIAGTVYGPRFLSFGGNDRLTGGGKGSALLLGGAGDDVIENRPSAPQPEVVGPQRHVLAGEAGRDQLIGSSDDEELYGDFYRVIDKSSGPNSPYFWVDAFLAGGTSGSEVTGGYDWPYDGSNALNSEAHTYPGGVVDTLNAFLGITTNGLPEDPYDDSIDAGAGDDFVVGGPGNDDIRGGAGNDRLYGDNPRTTIVSSYYRYEIGVSSLANRLPLLGEPGDDRIDGGSGDDNIEDRAGTSSVVSGGDGNDSITVQIASDETPDIVTYANVNGGDGDDTILANANDVEVDGGSGDDDIEAVALEGTLIIDAGPGDDRINGFGVYVFVDGGAGADTYSVRGLDVTIHDDDADTGNIDTLELWGTPQDFQFWRDRDDLVIGYWTIVSDTEEDELVEGTITIEDWFAGARHQLEQIAFAPDGRRTTVWTPADVETAIDSEEPAAYDFIEPESPAPEPIVLAPLPPPAAQPAPEPDPPPAASSTPPPQPDPPPAMRPDPPPEPSYTPAAPAPEPAPEPDPPAPTPAVRLHVVDPGFTGRVAGSSAADTIAVLSDRGVVIDAGDGDDQVTTGSGADEIRLGSGNDVARTGGGDDRIVIDRFEGAKTIDGGPGIDALAIDRSLAAIRVSVEGDRIVIRDAGNNRLDATNVNVLEFADAVLVREGSESEADVARLYESLLGRMHDGPRATYWLDQVTAGGPLAPATGAFAGEPAGSSPTTSAQDEAFLDELYARAPDGTPDPVGKSWWLRQLQTGVLTREEVSAEFAACAEAPVVVTGAVLLPALP